MMKLREALAWAMINGVVWSWIVPWPYSLAPSLLGGMFIGSLVDR